MEHGREKKALVKVSKDNKNFSIVRAYTTQELVEAGLKDEEIRKVDTISLYDEVIVNPNLK